MMLPTPTVSPNSTIPVSRIPTDSAAVPVPAVAEGEFLASYDPSQYERPSVTVDVALFTIRNQALSILLVERADHPFQGHWALPGGFVEPDEDLDAAAYRELAEETGVALDTAADWYLEQLRTYGTPGRDPRTRVISVAHFALIPGLPSPVAGSDASHARWWAIEDLDQIDLAFDHADIVAYALERVRSKLEYTSLATRLLDSPFTISDLRRVYEAVWGAPVVEPSNFARKLKSADRFLAPLPVRQPATPHGGRPAQLFEPGSATMLYPPFLRDQVTVPDLG